MCNNQKLVPLSNKGYIIDGDYLISVKDYHTFEEIIGYPFVFVELGIWE